MAPKAADKKKSRDKVDAAPPPLPEEWRGSLKAMIYDPDTKPGTYLGTRTTGRAFASPYNWPATSATPVHQRTGPEWQPGGKMYNYSKGIA
mmetsp:Transcript_68988/g.180824  ORF Transcript_68988/g.180824 Transcript_68988/m.180824 type:complete len:91 (+) Transcript_68988:94-366(+)